MRSPPEDLWEFPGFPSLTVQYGNRNDYYFNPVPAICIQLFAEYREQGQRVLMLLSLLALVASCYLSLCLRGHYSIDNFGGLVLGHYIWLASNNWLCYFVDVKLFGMTLHERFPNMLQTNCQLCGTAINKWAQQKEIQEMMKQRASEAKGSAEHPAQELSNSRFGSSKNSI